MAEAIRLGRMTDTMEEGFISELYIKVGDVIKVGDTIADVETDKATLPLESYYKGEILFISAKKGEPLAIGGLVAIIGKKGEDFQHLLTEVAAPKSEPIAKVEEVKDSHIANVETIITTTTNSDARLKASPLAKSIAKEKGIDLSSIQGSGEDGRIVKRDIEKVKVATTAASIPVVNGQEGFSDVSVSQMRKTIAKRLSESMFTAPHFYLNMSINMDKAVAFRKELNEALETKISFNDLVLKAVAMSLRENPDVNTSWLGDKIRKYQHIHLGMAVAVDEGLVVPVIKFADQKSLRNLSTEAKALAQKAVAKKLSPAEMDGSTFTISNLGMFGIESFTAIINQPNACILAVGAIQQEPVVKDGKIEVGHIMKVSLSSDHRVVDGAVGSKFLISLKKYLESPLLMLI